jgi:hypothetical protein
MIHGVNRQLGLALTRRGMLKVGPDTSTMHKPMAWRPNVNLIDGELDNRVPGKVTGWMRFFRNGKQPLKALFDLTGDFHEDIRGKAIRLRNPNPADEYHEAGRTYMEGFSPAQRGVTGDITAGLSLGPWTDAIAEKLMAQNEILWEEAGTSQAERGRSRHEYANATASTSRRATSSILTSNTRTSNGIPITAGWFWSWTLRRWKSWRAFP